MNIKYIFVSTIIKTHTMRINRHGVTDKMRRRFWEHSVNPITGWIHSDRTEEILLTDKETAFENKIRKNFNQ